MNTVLNFTQQVVALIQGDDAKATALKIQRQANSALKTQISALEGETIDLEDGVENAKENLRLATLNNGQKIDNKSAYVRSILDAKNRLTRAEENLADHLEKIAFLKEVFEAVSKDEEASSLK